MYLLVHRISEPERSDLQKNIDYIMNNFDVFDMSGIDPHITLKYSFEEKDLSLMQSICEEVTRTSTTGTYSFHELGDFSKETIFLIPELDAKSKAVYEKLFSLCKEKGVCLHDHEKEGIHFHITLAQKVKKDYDKIIEYLTTQNFNSIKKFNNLTILKFTGEDFLIHKEYFFS